MRCAGSARTDTPVVETPGPVAVVAAMREEIQPLLRRMRARAGISPNGLRTWHGEIGGRSIVLARTGDGSRNAERGARQLLDGLRPEVLIGVGIAGALSRDLTVGDLVVGERLFDGNGEAPGPPADWRNRARELGAARPASVWSAERIVCRPEAKRELAARLPAGLPGVVDLESAAWARSAGRIGCGCLILRVVGDGGEEALPAFLSECQDPGGPLRRAAVVWRALARPREARRLLVLRARLAAAGERLAECLSVLLK